MEARKVELTLVLFLYLGGSLVHRQLLDPSTNQAQHKATLSLGHNLLRLC